MTYNIKLEDTDKPLKKGDKIYAYSGPDHFHNLEEFTVVEHITNAYEVTSTCNHKYFMEHREGYKYYSNKEKANEFKIKSIIELKKKELVKLEEMLDNNEDLDNKENLEMLILAANSRFV
jgi:hypothetical protein